MATTGERGTGRSIAVIGAPSSIGIRPYEEGGAPRRLDLAPGALRELGLVRRLAARDLGDVTPPPYRDFTRPPGAIRNEEAVTAYLSEVGPDAVARRALERVARAGLDGFWIHLDADVLDPGVMPAVDSPEPGGPGLKEVAALVGLLADHPKARGLELTIYDPALDPELSCAARLVALLEASLVHPRDTA